MNKRATLIAIAVSCLAVLLGFVNSTFLAADDKTVENPTGDTTTISKRGLEKGVVVDVLARKVFRRGSETLFAIKITNTRAQPVNVRYSGYAPRCRAVLIDVASGKEIDLTPQGENRLMPRFGRSSGQAELVTGKSVSWKVDIAHCFMLTKGTFKLAFTILFDAAPNREQWFEVEVDPIPFVIESR
jgi:hypothetical protein